MPYLCEKNNWEYSIVTPKENLPDIIKSNILFLWNFLKPRKNTESWLREIEEKITYLDEITVIELAKSFSGKIDYRAILPLIWHLVSIGKLQVNLMKKFDQYSDVKMGNIQQTLQEYIYLEDRK
ncbi:hypothetical protein A499_25173 [Niallia nealsonii AAU1]|nr:hypothetical protein A499_25173 [Niallia nealsonii AAU1]